MSTTGEGREPRAGVPVEITDLVTAAGKATQVDPTVESDESLMDTAVMLERARALIDATQAAVLGQLHAHNTTDIAVGTRTGPWLAHTCGLPRRVGRNRVDVAAALRSHFDQIAAAITDGRLSWEHATALVALSNPRIADQLALVQDQIIDWAAGTTFQRWHDQVQALANLLDQDGGYNPNNDRDANRLHIHTNIDGRTRITGELWGLDGIHVARALETVADQLYRRSVREHNQCDDIPVPSRATLQAEALVELILRGRSTPKTGTVPPNVDVTLVTHTTDLTDIRTQAGVRLQDGTTRALIADPRLFPVIVDSLGVPLDMGTEIRFFNRAQRRAIHQHYGGCSLGGCDAPPEWTHIHHTDPAHLGGETNTDKGLPLCAHHHGVTHRKGWTLHQHHTGPYYWTTPTGDTIWTQRNGRTTRPPDEPEPRPNAPG